MYPHPPKQPIRWVYLFLFAFFMIIWSPSKAQHSSSKGMNADGDVMHGNSYNSGGIIRQDGWSVALSGGYEAPLGDLKETYNAAPTFGATVTRRMGNVIYTGTADYRSYKPKQSEFPYTYDDVTYLTATYSNYQGIGLYAGIGYELPITGLLDVYGGINGGVMFTKYEMYATDGAYTDSYVSSSSKISYLGPKLGFNCAINRKISIGIEARYSLGISGASYNTRYGGSTTKAFNSYAGNLFLTYSF
ncbi:hypothetical protein [Mucilaginibacter segetis]|uniref:Outer membrane protein beta-barrel domain-containing protein n=1 Tax=Mucilaginibacter segetis TaxID=2793071 RepID=A0A934PXB2_9SPHI|nr:hypothetical protein [Mucilaginibacter segetis]MBK0380743.1 hypothetical protein [Mucilaginibacter segetis]